MSPDTPFPTVAPLPDARQITARRFATCLVLARICALGRLLERRLSRTGLRTTGVGRIKACISVAVGLLFPSLTFFNRPNLCLVRFSKSVSLGGSPLSQAIEECMSFSWSERKAAVLFSKAIRYISSLRRDKESEEHAKVPQVY